MRSRYETRKYQIESKAGVIVGIYEGFNEAHALCKMHENAGYITMLTDNNNVTFFDDKHKDICGDIHNWIIKEII